MLDFTEKEVHKALLDLVGIKAPEPNRFTIDFSVFSCEVVKDEIMGV